VSRRIEEYVRSLELDAYVVGGAVRDALLGIDAKDSDFLVPGVDIAGLRALLVPYGRTAALVVAGRPVGVRFFPRDRAIRTLAPAGIELAPPRREVSTGPGRHDFDIVVDPAATIEEDLARRDFTINAIARRLADGSLVDPFGGGEDLSHRVLRTVSANGFAEDPLRLVRGLRFVSQLDLDPDGHTLAQMRDEAAGVRLVSGERIGGGLASDSLGELSKLLLGARPAKALRLARDTGVLAELLPEFAPAIGFRAAGGDAPTVDEHAFAVVQAAAEGGMSLPVRLAALLHDLGKPAVAGRGGDGHEEAGAALAAAALSRLRYPTELRRHVLAIVRFHTVPWDGVALDARRLLARHGAALALDLLDHREADLRGKRTGVEPPAETLERLDRFRALVREQQRAPHRLRDLAVTGDDLLALGFRSGPAVGDALRTLLGEVVKDPSLNTREALLVRAEELLRT
jgi:tRNA nucleotidyltransferase/poly(A) polymerase